VTTQFVKLPDPRVDACGRCKQYNVYNMCLFGQEAPSDGTFPPGAPHCVAAFPSSQCDLYKALDR
jgi:hypothetical protein